MSAHPNNGGPAFPTENAHQSGSSTWHHEGMTLRDYFAAKAMQGLLSCPVQQQSGADMFARDAYTMADAMLSAREAT